MPAAFVPHRLGLVMVVACMSVFVSGAAIYNAIFLGEIMPQIGAPLPLTVACGVLFNTVWVLAVWSYFGARCTRAGGIPDRWSEFAEDYRLTIGPARQEWQPGQATRCNKCSGIRPERTHHCGASGVCALRMDHYCPWTATCIGFHNHKFFILLATYNLLSVFVFFVTTLPVSYWVVKEWLVLGLEDVERVIQAVLVLLTMLVSAVLSYLLGDMVRDHASRAFRNVTSIEEHYDNMPNPYDLGDRWLNVAQLFGTFGVDWFLPVTPWNPVCDGISFARSGEEFHGSEPGDVELEDDDRPECEELWHRRYIENHAAGRLQHFHTHSRGSSGSDETVG